VLQNEEVYLADFEATKKPKVNNHLEHDEFQNLLFKHKKNSFVHHI